MSAPSNKEIMASNLSRLMKRDSCSRHDLSKALNVPYSTISDWLTAKTYPRIDKIEMLAHFFETDKSDLVEDNTAPKHSTNFSMFDTALVKAFHSASDEQQRIIRFMLNLPE